jgi:FkbM family methyltransferase
VTRRTVVDRRGERFTFMPRPHTPDDVVIDECWKGDTYLVDCAWRHEEVEPGVAGWRHELADGLVVDVGANIGSFTVQAASTGAVVYALEPDGESAERLHAHLEANELLRRVEVVRAAVARTGGTRFFRGGLASGSHLAVEGEEHTVVPAASLDEVVRDALAWSGEPQVALLKVDVEGAEYETFESVSRATMDAVERLVLEFHVRVDGLTQAHFPPPGHVGPLLERLGATHSVQVIGRTTVGGIVHARRY